MKDRDILNFVTSECEPIESPAVEQAYRCAAYLVDGLYLPCVLVASKRGYVELALKRFDETRADASGLVQRKRFGAGFEFVGVVESFVAEGNRLNTYDIARLEPSRYAIPRSHLREIRGETSMAWTQFTARMRDGEEFSFGTTFNTEFFSMPEGYSGIDVIALHPHKRNDGPLYRERPFFTCFVDGL